MQNFNPLFITGVARSGTTLVAKMLDAHASMLVASDPLFPLFHSLRTALIQSGCETKTLEIFNSASPIGDYYFRPEGAALIDAVQNGTLNEPMDAEQWPLLIERLRRRAAYECPDLLNRYDELLQPSYKASIERAIEIIATTRGTGQERWVGIKDVWITELIPVLARTFPSARFVVVNRDPRGACASAISIDDVSQRPHPLSFARHCRKHLAFVHEFTRNSTLSGRVHICNYEDLVRQPEREMASLCTFLDLEYDSNMVNPGKFTDYATGQPWHGNSSYIDNLHSISDDQADAWKTQLGAATVQMIEFVVQPEMKVAGYSSADPLGSFQSDPSILEEIFRCEGGDFSWRTDFGDAIFDYGLELSRLPALLSASKLNDTLIRRLFLFQSVYASARAVLEGNSAGQPASGPIQRTPNLPNVGRSD